MVTVEIRCLECNKYTDYTYEPYIKGDMLVKHNIVCGNCDSSNLDLRTTRKQ